MMQQSPKAPTSDSNSATTGRHHQDGPQKIGVGCLIKVYATPAGQHGKHARTEPTAVAS
ncbi:hypothetical protein AB0425_17885 [Actinosynnema sp. NPDC051121]